MLRERVSALERENDKLVGDLRNTHYNCEQLEQMGLEAERNRDTAEGRVKDLETQIEYLKEQVKIYQVRLGLLPQERQGQSDGKKLEPLKKGREPFSVVQARIETQQREAYWRKRADEAENSLTGKTTDTPTVSEETQ